MTLLTELLDKIDNLSIRERGIVFVGILFVLYTAWDFYLMQPLGIEQKKIESELQQKQASQIALNARIQKLIVNKDKDPNMENREKLAELKARLKDIESKMYLSTAHLISPKNMARILETVLHKIKGLRLVEVKGLGVSALIQNEKKKKQEDKQSVKNENSIKTGEGLENAYKHGLKIEFEGDYMSTLDYIRILESLEWSFFWDSFELQVKEYPESRASITVFTLSMDKNWIGI